MFVSRPKNISCYIFESLHRSDKRRLGMEVLNSCLCAYYNKIKLDMKDKLTLDSLKKNLHDVFGDDNHFLEGFLPTSPKW